MRGTKSKGAPQIVGPGVVAETHLKIGFSLKAGMTLRQRELTCYSLRVLSSLHIDHFSLTYVYTENEVPGEIHPHALVVHVLEANLTNSLSTFHSFEVLRKRWSILVQILLPVMHYPRCSNDYTACKLVFEKQQSALRRIYLQSTLARCINYTERTPRFASWL